MVNLQSVQPSSEPRAQSGAQGNTGKALPETNPKAKSRKWIIIILVFLFLGVAGCLYYKYNWLTSSLDGTSLDSGSDLEQVVVNYSWSGLGPLRSFDYKVSKVGSNFQTDEGKKVSMSKIVNLNNSLVNFQKSGGMKSCISHTDDYPNFRVEIVYKNGDRVILYSSSNCKSNIPWNVVIKDSLYVQYTGEIPRVLYDLLSDKAADDWGITSGTVGFGGEVVSIISDKLPEEISKVDYSEKELYQQILTESDLFGPYKADYEVSDLRLVCQLGGNNRDCLEIDGIISLRSLDSGSLESAPVKFKNKKVVKIDYESEERKSVNKVINEHRLSERIKSISPDSTVVISSPTREYNEFVSLLALGIVGKEHSAHSFRFDKWEADHRFVYFPKVGKIWVDSLDYSKWIFAENKDVIDISRVLDLYRIPGYETFVDDNIVSFEIQTCHRVLVNFKDGSLKQNPDYMTRLRERYPDLYNYEDRLDIHCYCIFVNGQGELEGEKSTRCVR